jgi:hypothetical protein
VNSLNFIFFREDMTSPLLNNYRFCSFSKFLLYSRSIPFRLSFVCNLIRLCETGIDSLIASHARFDTTPNLAIFSPQFWHPCRRSTKINRIRKAAPLLISGARIPVRCWVQSSYMKLGTKTPSIFVLHPITVTCRYERQR